LPVSSGYRRQINLLIFNGDTLYLADTDAILKFPYRIGQTSISERGVELADLAEMINHHWTKSLLASGDGSKLYVGMAGRTAAVDLVPCSGRAACKPRVPARRRRDYGADDSRL
jgi:glucose/arabinose dehydrogenase